MNTYLLARHHAPRNVAGFSLVEMAIVLAIVGLLLGALLPTLSSQIEQQRRTETRKYMDEVRDALLGYAIANKRLPCPAANDNGSAQATCTTTASQFGKLPYKDLGVTDKDAFGSVLVYAVTKEFAVNTFTLNTLGTANTMAVCPSASNCPATYLTNNAVVVVVSRGANWASATSTDELENTNNNENFVSKDFVQGGYDDLVLWISPNTLFNRMVAAGKLP